jgi:choline kinase
MALIGSSILRNTLTIILAGGLGERLKPLPQFEQNLLYHSGASIV